MRWIGLAVFAGCTGGVDKGSLTVPDDKGDDDDNQGDDDDDDDDDDTQGDDDDTVGPELVLSDPSHELHEMGSLVYVRWNQSLDATLHVEYSFDAGDWLSSPSRAFSAGANEQLLVGIPFSTDATWRVVADDADATLEGDPVATDSAPPNLPLADLLIDEPSSQLPGARWLLTSINANEGGWTNGTYWAIVLDRQGRAVWATRAPNDAWTLFAQIAVTGDRILWDEQRYWSEFGEGENSVVHSTYLDEEIEIIPTPGLHHAFLQLPDGTLVWGSQAHGGGEALVQKAPGQPDEDVLWTCANDWPDAGFSCESNGLFWVESTDSFLYSFYTNSSIIEIDHATGDALWWAGEAPGGYDFVPSGTDFSWQHGISYTNDGTLLVSSEYGYPQETWLLEYEVDHSNETLELVWSNSSDVRADTNGQAWRLNNGNTLHIVGSAGVIREVTGAGDDVWRLDFHGDFLLGHGQFIEDLYTLVSPE